MSNKALKQFVQLRNQLMTEKKTLEARLQALNQALESTPVALEDHPSRGSSRRAVQTSRRGRKDTLSLRSAVVEVTKDRALTKKEILDAVIKLGYKFRGKKPILSLSTLLYGKNSGFKNLGGKFQAA